MRARRRARRRHRARAALPRDRRRGQQPARRRRVAVQLADRGIVWAPDFVANAGGIINIAVELEAAGYDADRAEERVRGVADTTRAVFDHAEATGATTLAAAMEIARRRLAEAAAAA